MKLKIIIVLSVIFITACAGGTRGTGATIDRRFNDTMPNPMPNPMPNTMPNTHPSNQQTKEKSLYDILFAPDCDEEDGDCE